MCPAASSSLRPSIIPRPLQALRQQNFYCMYNHFMMFCALGETFRIWRFVVVTDLVNLGKILSSYRGTVAGWWFEEEILVNRPHFIMIYCPGMIFFEEKCSHFFVEQIWKLVCVDNCRMNTLAFRQISITTLTQWINQWIEIWSFCFREGKQIPIWFLWISKIEWILERRFRMSG